MKDVKWIDGAPEKLEPGMLIMRGGRAHDVCIVGSLMYGADERALLDQAIAWAWLIHPHEIAWLESMAKAHKVGQKGEGK